MQSLDNGILADSYVLLLDSLDGINDGDGVNVVPDVVIRNQSSVIFEVTLPYRRLWRYTVLAHGCDQHPVTTTTNLSN